MSLFGLPARKPFTSCLATPERHRSTRPRCPGSRPSLQSCTEEGEYSGSSRYASISNRGANDLRQPSEITALKFMRTNFRNRKRLLRARHLMKRWTIAKLHVSYSTAPIQHAVIRLTHLNTAILSLNLTSQHGLLLVSSIGPASACRASSSNHPTLIPTKNTRSNSSSTEDRRAHGAIAGAIAGTRSFSRRMATSS